MLTLKSGKDRAGKRNEHDTSRETLLAPEVHTTSDRNQDNLYACNHILHFLFENVNAK